MPKIIPVLFTSANHLTPAHVQILSEATKSLNKRGFVVPNSVISPVHDHYITHKHYDKVTINGKSFARSLFDGKERLKMSQATIDDAKAQNMKVFDYEVNHTSVPNGNQKRGYIEHWEMLEYLQCQEIERCKVYGEEPGLFVLVGGADLANSMNNWAGNNGMPFLIATRKTEKNPTGKLKSNQNFISPAAYLKRLGYEGDAFNKFISGEFEVQENAYSGLSSTQLASCEPKALKLMGNTAFEQLLSILIARSQSSTFDKAQVATAKASLKAIKSHALTGQLDAGKKAIVERIFKVETTNLPQQNDLAKEQELEELLKKQQAEQREHEKQQLGERQEKPHLQQESLKEERYQNLVNTAISKIDAALQTLQNKIGKENQHYSSVAFDNAIVLLRNLQNARNAYCSALLEKPYSDAKTNNAGKQFNKKCETAINDVKQILEGDLGWENYLINLLKTLANVIILVVSFGQINSFFPLKKSVSEDAIEQAREDLELHNTGRIIAYN